MKSTLPSHFLVRYTMYKGAAKIVSKMSTSSIQNHCRHTLQSIMNVRNKSHIWYITEEQSAP